MEGRERGGESLTIQQTPSGQILIHHPMRRAPFVLDIIPEAIIRRDTEHLSQSPALDQVPHLHTKREISRPDSFHEKQVLLLSRLAQDLGLGCIHGKRLFAEHILSRLKSEQDILEVVRMRRRDVHHVHVGVGHQLLVGSVGGAGGWDTRVGDEFGGTVLGRRGCHRCHGVRDVGGVADGRVVEEISYEDCRILYCD